MKIVYSSPATRKIFLRIKPAYVFRTGVSGDHVLRCVASGRRAICLGLRMSRRMTRAFSACVRGDSMSWGVAPGFNEAAPVALSMHEARRLYLRFYDLPHQRRSHVIRSKIGSQTQRLLRA